MCSAISIECRKVMALPLRGRAKGLHDRARGADDLHDVLQRLEPLSRLDLAVCSVARAPVEVWVRLRLEERRAIGVRIADDYRIAAGDEWRFRSACRRFSPSRSMAHGGSMSLLRLHLRPVPRLRYCPWLGISQTRSAGVLQRPVSDGDPGQVSINI